MLKKVQSIIFLVIILFIHSTAVKASTYSRYYYGKKLTLNAPVIYNLEDGVIASSGESMRLKVRFMYEKQLFYANKVILKKNKVYLQNGFLGSSKKSTFTGDELVYNLENNYFDGKDMEVTSGLLKISTKRLYFYGERIDFQEAKFGLTFFDLKLKMDKIFIYPGWAVIKNFDIGTEDQTYYRIPVWVLDMRRNAFEIPYPLPQAGSSIQRGNYLLLNNHYYFNEVFYGFFRMGTAQRKGAMAGVGQIVRLGDQDQFYLGGDFWQWAEPQLKAEYNHSFMKLPYRQKRLTFGEMLEYNKTVKDLDSSDIRTTFTKREIINDEYVDRDMEFSYKGHFGLTSKLDLDLDLASGHIYEYSSDLRAMRTNSNFNFSYLYPLGWFDPLWWGVGYNRSDYDLKPFTWQRLYGTVAWEREFWFFLLGIKYTHYFHDKGGSPFIFDQKYVVNNNIIYNLRIGKKAYHLGAKFLADVKINKLVDTTYYLGWTFSGWQLEMQYSTQREALSMGVQVDLF
ncbi:MAG: hypothetical protein KKA19_09840 [Candidatus Margulisbacteria bacterium]|nr:hypothetical protein [Candidatus Margulisiibacteriota bacterium]